MSYKPKVSIIITCFNQGKYLIDSIGSLKTQSLSDWECIIIDDGSSDNTKETAIAFMSKDSRIKYFRQENQGISIARNFGISLAHGDFIQFLDADDTIHSGKFAYQVEQLESHPQIDMIYGSSRYFFDSSPEVLYPLHLNGAIPCDLSWKDRFQVEMILKSNICTNCSILFRRSVTEKVKFRNQIYEDWVFNLECALQGFVFHFDNSPYSYSFIRMTDASQMMKHSNHIFKLEQFETMLMELVKEFGYPLDEKIVSFRPIGFSGKVKSLFRKLTPPLFYSFGAYLKRQLS